MTIDVEDYYQVTNFEKYISRDDWNQFPSRVVANTHHILGMLDAYGVKATFFVLGYVAERHPQLVSEIVARGHEVGSHGYWHRLVYEQTPEEFRQDIRYSKDLLQQQSQQAVISYRSPSFSIVKRSLWALEVLAEEGFEIDASIFPVHHHRYGIPDAPCDPYRIELTAGQLWEFPATVGRIARWNVPIAGGGYFRLYPLALTERLLRRVNNKYSQAFIFYAHPWEFDPDQPRLHLGTAMQRFRHYVNLASTTRKFEHLLQTFRFGRLDQVLKKCTVDSLSNVLVAS